MKCSKRLQKIGSFNQHVLASHVHEYSYLEAVVIISCLSTWADP